MEPEETSGTDCDCSTTAGTLFCLEKRRTNLCYPKNPALFSVFNRPLTAAVLFILVFVFSRNLWREGTLTLTRDHLVAGLSTLNYVRVNPLTLPERASRDAIWTLVRGVTVSSIVSVCRLQRCLETSEKIRLKKGNLASWCFDPLFSEREETAVYLLVKYWCYGIVGVNRWAEPMLPYGNSVQVPEANHYKQNYVAASVNWSVTGSKHQQPSRLSAAQKNPNSFPTDTDAAGYRHGYRGPPGLGASKSRHSLFGKVCVCVCVCACFRRI